MKNVLLDIMERYPDAWRETKRFRAILMDLLPENKVCRNMLCVSLDEKIPDDIYGSEEIDSKTFFMLSQRLMKAYGCTEKMAEEIVTMWCDGLRVPLADRELNDYTNIEERVIGDDNDSRTNDSESVLKSFDDLTKRFDAIQKSMNTVIMMANLREASECFEMGDYKNGIKKMEEAVENGYKKDYSIISYVYLGGLGNVRKNTKKGTEWLKRFYTDVVYNGLELDDQETMIQVCYNLGALEARQYVKDHNRDHIEKIVEYWKEAIKYAKYRSGTNEKYADTLFIIGSAFHSGCISAESSEPIEIGERIILARRALRESKRYGDKRAQSMLDEMFDDPTEKFEITEVVVDLKRVGEGSERPIIESESDDEQLKEKCLSDEVIESMPEWSDSESWQYTINWDGSITIKEYDGKAKRKLVIPERIDGRLVEAIDDGFIIGATGLIWDVQEIELPPSLKRIEKMAFYNMNVKKIILPEGLEHIGDAAFWGCPMERIFIPKSVRNIGKGAFMECHNLYVEVDSRNRYYSSGEGCLYDIKRKKLIFHPYNKMEIQFDSSVEELGEGLFAHLEFDGSELKLSQVVIPNTVKIIDRQCFSGQKIEIVLHKDIVYIDEEAFDGCTLDGDIEEILKDETEICDYCFSGTSIISKTGKIRIPDSIRSIGCHAFYEMSGIDEISIPGSITKLDMNIFNPDKMYIKTIVFEEGIEQIVYTLDEVDLLPFSDKKVFKNLLIYIPESVIHIDDELFINCEIHCISDSFAASYYETDYNNKIVIEEEFVGGQIEIAEDESILETQEIEAADLMDALNAANKAIKEEDYTDFVSSMQKAVEAGYKGDYSLIGKLLIKGYGNLPRDIYKGKNWLERFHNDFINNRLEVDNKELMIEVCYNLGVLELQSYSINRDEKKVQLAIEYWKEAISFAQYSECENEGYADTLFVMGAALTYGGINLEGCGQLEIPTFERVAIDAIRKSIAYGNVGAWDKLYQIGYDADDENCERVKIMQKEAEAMDEIDE